MSKQPFALRTGTADQPQKIPLVMINQPGQNRRRYVRLAADEKIDCAIGGQDVVHVVGIGSHGHGMRVITDRELPDGEEIPVSLVLAGEESQAQARVVWQESWDFGFCNRHVAGIEFTQVSDSLRQKLLDLIPDEDSREPVPDDEF